SGVIVSSDSVYQAVASLRRQLGDDSRQPIYIETVPRLGYRMVAPVSRVVDQSMGQAGEGTGGSLISESEHRHRESEPPSARPSLTDVAALHEVVEKTSIPASTEAHASAEVLAPASRIRAVFTRVAGVALGLSLVSAFLFYGRPSDRNRPASNASAASIAPLPQKSIGVLPFLDLTSESMDQEYFADGMTEELIDKLSKIPGVRVPGPTSSFYFKGKKIPVADIAKSMGVAYLLDGSIRKSGGRLRVAARLIRADSGYVVWTETYDRPLGDVLKVQDDIAGQVTKAVRASIEGEF
ncbi:MAG: hypothetical protein ACREDR_40025, partial [Blastocatellia bacterium]